MGWCVQNTPPTESVRSCPLLRITALDAPTDASVQPLLPRLSPISAETEALLIWKMAELRPPGLCITPVSTGSGAIGVLSEGARPMGGIGRDWMGRVSGSRRPTVAGSGAGGMAFSEARRRSTSASLRYRSSVRAESCRSKSSQPLLINPATAMPVSRGVCHWKPCAAT